VPVTYELASEAKKTAKPAISSGFEALLNETLFTKRSSAPSNSSNPELNLVLT
jgi:hypothetical protein